MYSGHESFGAQRHYKLAFSSSVSFSCALHHPKQRGVQFLVCPQLPVCPQVERMAVWAGLSWMAYFHHTRCWLGLETQLWAAGWTSDRTHTPDAWLLLTRVVARLRPHVAYHATGQPGLVHVAPTANFSRAARTGKALSHGSA